MKIEQSFLVDRPVEVVWDAFQDVPAMAQCLPGATLTEDKGGGVYAGRIDVKLGPFSASFEGEAKVTTDPAGRTGHVEGKGVDRRGGSRSRMTVDYTLVAEEDRKTRVDIAADVVLSGPIAQFGRTGLIVETSNILIREFVEVLEKKLAATSAAQAQAVQAGDMRALPTLVRALIAWLKSLLGRSR